MSIQDQQMTKAAWIPHTLQYILYRVTYNYHYYVYVCITEYYTP